MSLIQQSRSPQDVIVSGTLLDAQASNTNGVWFSIERITPWSVTLRGTFSGATVTIYVSNQVTKPLDSDNLQAIFQTFTTPFSAGSTIPFRWIKAQVTGIGGGGSITVDVLGGS